MPQYRNNEIRLENNSEIDNNLKAVEIGSVASPVYISKNAVKLFSNSTFIIGESLTIIDDSKTQDVTFKGNMYINSSYFSDSITLAPNIDILAEMSIKIKEKAAANDDTAGYGQLWIKTASPNELYFTNDAGNDIQLTSGSSVVGGGGSGDMEGVDLTGGTGIEIASEANTTSGSYTATINCDLEGTELKSTGETGTTKFLRTDSDGTCSWQVPSYIADTTYTVGDGGLTQNNFTNTLKSKLDGIEELATADQTKADINALDITEVGTITSGVWTGTAIADANIASASTWNAKSDLALGTSGSTALAGNTALLQIGTSGSTAMAGNTAVGDSNVKSNWNESDTNDDSFIQNKPNVQYTSAISTGNNGLVPAAGSAGEFLKHDGTFGTPSYIANTDVDVSVANLDARLEQLTATMVTVGDATDVTIDFEGGIQIGQGAVFMTEPSVTVGGGLTAWSWTQGNKLDLTLASGATAITFDTPHPQGGCSLTLKLTQPASGSAGTAGSWNASGAGNNVKWPSGTAPTLSTANGAVDILSFYWDGTNYYGVASLNFS